jgi:GDP-L-fucose synthase
MIKIDRDSKVFVAGHRGLVGSAVLRSLRLAGFENIVVRTHRQLELTNQAAVDCFFAQERPQVVIMAAARVGGIEANNSHPALFIRDNLAVQSNVIDAAHRNAASKVVFLGSSCIYPKLAPQPIKEEYLLTGPLEPTNEWYAVAKIAGVKMCQAYRREFGLDAISLMPTNLYGPGDNFDLGTSHVLPALMRRFHESRARGDQVISIWGTGTQRREFLHVDDLARALVFLMQNYSGEGIVNVGCGEDVTIRELAELMADVTGFKGTLEFDVGKPDGTPRKLLDISRLTALGWQPEIGLKTGIGETYSWFKDNILVARLTA